jgi:hypothetical protein
VFDTYPKDLTKFSDLPCHLVDDRVIESWVTKQSGRRKIVASTNKKK